MRVLLVVTKAEIGGAQSFVLTLARGIKAAELEVAVAFGDGDFLPHELKKDSIPPFYIKSLKKSRNPFRAIRFIFELRKLIRKEGFDVVHFNSTNTLPGVLAVKFSRKKIKTVFTVHGLSVLDRRYKTSFFLRKIFKFYFKLFIGYVDKIIFVSKLNFEFALKQRLVQGGSVIYNGVSDKNFLEREDARRKLENLAGVTLEGKFLMGSIGRLAYPKNYDFLLNIWEDIKKIKPEAKLIIIADGPDRSRYKKIVTEKGLEKDIFFVGEMKNAGRFVKGFDLFVLPSIFEGLSISLIEALVAGMPAIASRVGGNEEIIGVENCFDLNNKESFLALLEKGPKTREIRRSDFSTELMVKEYLNVYRTQ